MTERIVYKSAVDFFITPRGNTAKMHYRLDTNDWNTINASMTADEYHLGKLPLLTGLAVDIGAYVGSVGIALALDNPELRVICIEPVPENFELIAANVHENNLQERVMVIETAAAASDVKETTVRWRYRGTELADHHAFVGNCSLAEGTGATNVDFEQGQVGCISLSKIVQRFDTIDFLKIDCEGCEWSTLSDTAVRDISIISGEWHPCGGKTQAYLHALLDSSHILSFEGPVAGPGGFHAVRKTEFFQKNEVKA